MKHKHKTQTEGNMSKSRTTLFAEKLYEQIQQLFIAKTEADCTYSFEKQEENLKNIYYYKKGDSERILEIRLDVKPGCIADLENLSEHMRITPKSRYKGYGFEFLCLATEDHDKDPAEIAAKFEEKIEKCRIELGDVVKDLLQQCADFRKQRNLEINTLSEVRMHLFFDKTSSTIDSTYTPPPSTLSLTARSSDAD